MANVVGMIGHSSQRRDEGVQNPQRQAIHWCFEPAHLHTWQPPFLACHQQFLQQLPQHMANDAPTTSFLQLVDARLQQVRPAEAGPIRQQLVWLIELAARPLPDYPLDSVEAHLKKECAAQVSVADFAIALSQFYGRLQGGEYLRAANHQFSQKLRVFLCRYSSQVLQGALNEKIQLSPKGWQPAFLGEAYQYAKAIETSR